jgi:hypothetical protein
MPSPGFSIEGGKLHLAESLFATWRFKIRCPNCVGNRLKPGFIKDEAGKGSKDGQSRRQWACQRSNGKGVTTKCPRASCTDFIALATQQLDPAVLATTISDVCARFPPDQEEYSNLRAYRGFLSPQLPISMTSSRSHITESSAFPSSHSSTTTQSSISSHATGNSGKRKAEEQSALPLTKAARHNRAQEQRKDTTFQTTSALASAVEPLESLVEMSKIWDQQLKLLKMFLTPSPHATPATSSDSISPPFLTSSPPPQSSPPSTSSPPTSSRDSPYVAPLPLASTPLTPLVAFQTEMITSSPMPPHIQRRHFASDAVIPSTYPDDLSSSPVLQTGNQSAAAILQGIAGAKDLSSRAWGEEAASSPSSVSQAPSSGDTIVLPVHEKDPSRRAGILVEQFRKAGKLRRVEIRQVARDEGIYHQFQTFLNYRQPLMPKNPNSRTSQQKDELKCSAQK